MKDEVFKGEVHDFWELIYIESGELSTEQIAELCCLGVSNLKKIFSMYAGCGVMHYFNTLKMIKAKELLRQDMSVAEISDRLSFSSPNYFTVFFKKQTGKLPTEYRREPQH